MTERRRSSHRDLDHLIRRCHPQRLVSQDSISEEGGGPGGHFVPARHSSRPYWATAANMSSNSSIDSDRRRPSTESTSRSIYSNRSR